MNARSRLRAPIIRKIQVVVPQLVHVDIATGMPVAYGNMHIVHLNQHFDLDPEMPDPGGQRVKD